MKTTPIRPHISTTQTELESTDHLALEKNGHRERDAILEEANSVTHKFDHSWSNTGSTQRIFTRCPPLRSTMEEPFAEGIFKGCTEELN